MIIHFMEKEEHFRNKPVTLPKKLTNLFFILALIGFFIYFKSSIQVFLVFSIITFYIVIIERIIVPFLNKNLNNYKPRISKIMLITSNILEISSFLILIVSIFINLIYIPYLI